LNTPVHPGTNITQRKAVGRMTPMKWLKPPEELESWCAQALRW